MFLTIYDHRNFLTSVLSGYIPSSALNTLYFSSYLSILVLFFMVGGLSDGIDWSSQTASFDFLLGIGLSIAYLWNQVSQRCPGGGSSAAAAEIKPVES